MHIFYELRDGYLYDLTLEVKVDKPRIYVIKEAKRYKKDLYPKNKKIGYVNYNKYYSYSRTTPENIVYTENTKEQKLLCLKLKHYNKKERNVIFVDAESFYVHVEMGGESHIVIDSISAYIEWIQIYQTVSMFVTCEDVLHQFVEKMYCITTDKEEIEKTKLNELRDLANDSKDYILKEIALASGGICANIQDSFNELYDKIIKVYNTIIESNKKRIESNDKIRNNKTFMENFKNLKENYTKLEENHNKLLNGVEIDFEKRNRIIQDRKILEKIYDIELGKEEVSDDQCIRTQASPSPLKRIKGDALGAVRQVLVRCDRGDYSMYYRGVGHIIYPDMPSVFRGDRKYEEDRMYKAMMIAFPKEFSGLRYLDRLAKLQHFELSTRLLDVSSNPLVALYMACNTIYTRDEKQIDWGEVLLYFMAGEKERAYDSKSILINAALVKVPYVEKTVMYQFIYIHKAYMYNQMKGDEKIGIRNKYQEILNRCVHLACDYGIEATIPSNEAESIKQLFMETNNTYTREKMDKRFAKARTARDFCWLCMEGVRWPAGDRNWRSVGCSDKFSNYTKKVEKEQYDYLFNEVVNAYNDLLITIRRENPAFQNKINLFELLKSFHGNIGMTNERILAQSGSFIISGLENLYICREMKSTRSEGYIRMIIRNKEKIFEELRMFNITDATMLPDITHKAKYLLDHINT